MDNNKLSKRQKEVFEYLAKNGAFSREKSCRTFGCDTDIACKMCVNGILNHCYDKYRNVSFWIRGENEKHIEPYNYFIIYGIKSQLVSESFVVCRYHAKYTWSEIRNALFALSKTFGLTRTQTRIDGWTNNWEATRFQRYEFDGKEFLIVKK